MADVDGQIVLGLNIADTTTQISADLERVLSNIGKKEIVLSAKIENIKNDKITSQINEISKRLNQSLTMKDIKFNVSVEQSNIDRIKKELAGLKINDSGAKELTKEFTSMNVALEKVQHKLVEVKKAEDDGTESAQKLLNLTIQGTTEEGKLVNVVKQYNVETGEIVKTQTTITDNLKEQQREQENLTKKAQADNDARIKYLSEQKSLLEDIQAAYTGKTSNKGIKEESHLSDLKKQYDEIKATISQLEQANGALTQRQKSDINSQIADLKRLAKEYQNAEYAATQLRTKDITPIKEEQLAKLANFEKELDRSNILTTELKARITELAGQLGSAFDQKTLTAFLNNFDLLKLDAQSVKQEMAGLEAQFKQLEIVENKIANLQKQKIHTQDGSNEYNAINQQLQQQYNIRRQIAAEIERTATAHPELVQQSQELNKYLQQSHENAAKLAQEEAKVADQIANMANSYRDQAKNNSFENSISALEAKFQSLKNVSSEATTTMTNEFAQLRQYVETIATSTDNAQIIQAYNQFDAAIKRVSNNLQILQREEKKTEDATKAEADAVRQAAKEQDTLGRSATLSNNIQTWMNNNEKVAQKYGDRLRELQSILANNKDPALLTSARVEFAKIQSEAKAAGLMTDRFATSLKNTALQLLGLSSGIMVIRKIISVIKEGVNAVIELDTALIDLKKTTTMNGSDLVAFYKNANKAAIELGVTTKDIIQSAADWSRLGFSDKDSAEAMAKLAAQFAAISPGVSMDDATTGLVSVMKAYGIEVEDVLDGIMSKINIIGNTAATSNQQIITGLQNSSAAMAAMGSTLEENIALFTAAQEITQDESKVGNALRSISMRIRGYDEETEELSEDLANISGEVVDLTKTASNMQGVSLFTDATQTEYKSIYQYLKEISEIYDELGAKEQQQLMEKLFGKNRASVGQAILQNFAAAEKAMKNMAESAGNADAEMEIVIQSLEYKLNAFKETAVGIWQDIFPRESIGAFIDAGTSLLELIGNIIDACGGLGNTLLILVDIIALLNFNKTVMLVQSLWTALSTCFGLLPKLISMFGNLKAAWALGKEAGGGFITTLKNAASALVGTGSAASVATAGIMGVVAVIGIAVALYTNWKKKQEEARRELIESGNEAAENVVKIKDLAVKYLEFNDAVDAGTASVEDATAARDDLIEALGLEEDKIDELIAKYGDYKTAIIEAARESIRTDVNTAVAGANAAKDQVVEDLKTGWFGGNAKYISVIGNKEDEVKAVKDALELLDSLNYEGIDNTGTKGGSIFLPSVYLTGGDTAKASFDDLMADYEYLENAMNDVIEKFGADNPVAEELASLYNEYADELKPAIAAIEAANKGIASDLVLAQRAISDPKTQEEFEGFRQAIIDNMESDVRFDDRVGSVENYVDSVLSENDTYKQWLNALDSQEQIIDEITRKKAEIKRTFSESDVIQNVDWHTAEARLNEFNDYIESLSDEQVNLAYDIIINSNISGLDELKAAVEAANIENIVSKDKLKEYEELFSDYQSVLNEARLLGIDLSKTVYGNIDTNNRQILEWTDENLAFYKDAIESWGSTVDEMRGSISTVFGGSDEFDGVEIAFSPILQTENGAVLLDSNTVYEYIWGLIDKAGEGWTSEDLLRLDTEGLEMDGRVVKNLLADIGDTAIHTGEAMHFTGEAGAVNEIYDAIKEAADEAGISVEAFMYYFEHTGDQIAIQAKNIRDSLKGMWDSEDFADTKTSLIQMANTLDGITGQNIKDLAEDSSALKSILDQDGMSAEFLAKVLQTVADGKDGFALITESALLLNQALEGMVRDFDQVTEAKSRYDAAMSVPEKDEEFKSYAEAFKALNEQFEAGTTNSNAFWAAAEFLFGAEQLQTWGWSDGLDEIYAAMQKNVSIFEDADSAGAGFLERLYEIAENGKVLDEDGNILATIEKFADGSFTFDIDATSIDEIAQKLDITEEAALSCLKALSMWGDIDFYNVEEVLDAIEKIGLSSDSLEGTAINIDALTDQLISLGYTNKDIYDLLQTLQSVEGVTFLSASSDVDTLTNSLTNLGLATGDGIEVKVNTESLSILMEQLSFTKEDAQELITKLDEADGITLTNAKGEVQDLQSALEFIDTLDFATVETKVNSLGESIEDVDESSTDNAQSQLEAIGTSAETAEGKVHDLQTTINGLTGKTVTVSVDVKRKSSLLSMLGFAKGTKNAPDGAALTGEEGAELIKSGDQAYLAGTNGPEIVHLNKGDTVYTADETKAILKSGKYLSGSIPAYSGGYNGGTSGTIKPKGGTYQSVLSGNGSSTTTKELKDAVKETENLEDALEDTLKKMKEVMDDLIGDYEHTIFLMEHKGVNSDEIIKIYKAMQDAVHQQAEEYRTLGLDENSDYIQELQKQWWEYQDSIQELTIEGYEKTRKEYENQIKLSENWLSHSISHAQEQKVDVGVTFDRSELQELVDAYKEEIATAQELGIDLNKTIYGNIDTNNRQILDWTEDNLNKYKDALASWDTTVDEMRGSFSTIFGSSSEYDGVEIAFSPILQTENGPVLLDSHTVDKYIYGLIDKAGEGWTNEKLLQLDTEGLEFDGQIIKNLLADIGDTAIQTGEAMHYVGDLGSISTSYKELEAAAAAAQMTVDELNDAIANGSVASAGTSNIGYFYDVGSIEKHIADIISQYRKMQETIHEEAEYYRSLGYADTSDEVSELSDLWWDYYDKIAETSAKAWEQVVDNANDALDRITGIYDTLKNAAQEYADSGFITIDTLQEICSWGIQYLAYLSDENGQLVINEESIQRVIAARTEQMAVETALSYVQQIRSAIERNEIAELMNLTMATEISTNATWDLVYAQLKLLNVSGDLNDTMYAGALQNINNLRALSGIAITSIGKVEGSVKEANESAKKALQEQSDALDDLLKYVMAMIKQEVKNQIEALENQVDKMKEIVDLQKKSLQLEKEKDDYTKTVAEKTKELAKLQQQLALLELDDSRESAAKQAKLKEEIADLSNDLADTQADHAYDATCDMLDDMADAYEKEKKKEIEILENSISSEEKLYRLAIERIQTQWDTLYQQLIDWNYEYGSVTNDEITSVWQSASAAVEKYGSYLDAVLATTREIAVLEAQIEAYQSSRNSSHSSSGSSISTSIPSTPIKPQTNNVVGNSGKYDTSGDLTISQVKSIVHQMKVNSEAHHSADTEGKARLNKANLELGKQFTSLTGRTAVRGDDGVWYLDRVGGPKLYETYPYSTYHTGGIVGDKPTLKQNEVFAKLKIGEAVFTEEQQKPIYKALDFAETMINQFGGLFAKINATDMMNMRMQDDFNKDAQQIQNIVQTSSGNTFDINVPVEVHTVQKLDETEIRKLTKDISKYTITEINDSLAKKGLNSVKNPLRP